VVYSPRLFARIEVPTFATEPCDVVCRVCKDYRVRVPDLWAAQRWAWSHDVDHWRRRFPTPDPKKRGTRV
jgi:hypothetical protein